MCNTGCWSAIIQKVLELADSMLDAADSSSGPSTIGEWVQALNACQSGCPGFTSSDVQ